ncbi:MAG: hypothetical protein IJ282_06215 [Lachnospiraceae bacterium]|nr:hypothetical protein [Lachnospiraceae bacterium]
MSYKYILEKSVEKPTYCYITPVRFKGEICSDSRSLVQEFINNWDDAITTFKCGDWNDFWHTYVDADAAIQDENKRHFEEIYNAMWDPENDLTADILFAQAIHYFEPALKEIPCFFDYWENAGWYYAIGGEWAVLNLWNSEKLKDFFRRELDTREQKYLTMVMGKNLEDDWERSYDRREVNIRNACLMLREKLFSLYGYAGAEDEFLALLSDTAEPNKGTTEDYVKAYHKVADRLHQGFLYKDKVCTSLEEFGDLCKRECANWSLKEWDAFIKTLYEEKEGVLSFRQWILRLGKQELYRHLEDWKTEALEWKKIRDKVEYDTLSYDSLRPGKYLGDDNVETINARIDKWEKWADEWILNQPNVMKVEGLRNLYSRIYQYLEDAIGQMPQYDSIALNTEFERLIENWKEWVETDRRYYEENKMFYKVIRRHDELSLWNYDFICKTRWGGLNNREHLALLVCSPVEGIYQEKCEKFLQMIETGTEGCTPEEVQRYIELIFKNIYMELLLRRAEGRNESEIGDTYERIDYYFRFFERLSQKLPESIKLSDIMADEWYLKRIRWLRRTSRIKEKLKESRGGRQLAEKWEKYINENYNKISIAELHKAGEDMLKGDF